MMGIGNYERDQVQSGPGDLFVGRRVLAGVWGAADTIAAGNSSGTATAGRSERSATGTCGESAGAGRAHG